MEDTSIDKQLDEIIKDNRIFRYVSEMQESTDEKRKTELIDEIKNLNMQKQTNEEKAKGKIEQMCKAITVNSGKKKWFRLNEDIQITKLNEYIEKNNLNKEDIMKLYRSKALKGKKIVYDTELGVIKELKI